MRIDPSILDLKEKIVGTSKVTKVVKGGRNFRFSALIVVGDGSEHVGVGAGKFIEISEAIRKGVEDTEKNLVGASIIGTTVPHEIHRKLGTGDVLTMPATRGTGVIVGGSTRSVLELVGLKNARAKSLGPDNPRNVVKAAINGLTNSRAAENITKSRGESVGEIIG